MCYGSFLSSDPPIPKTPQVEAFRAAPTLVCSCLLDKKYGEQFSVAREYYETKKHAVDLVDLTPIVPALTGLTRGEGGADMTKEMDGRISRMGMDWFELLTGFRELSYEETRRNLEVVGSKLHSKINRKSYVTGKLETPSLKELRGRAQEALGSLAGKLRLTNVCGDVRQMHHKAAHERAIFQVASQFNLLEMVGPNVTPEDGVTRYQDDATQGPACAIAAGAATVYRNYFAPVDGRVGQTHDRQIDCLKDLGAALGNQDGGLWTMRNGYALCTEEGLATIDRKLASQDRRSRSELRDLLRIGIHWDVQVTDAPEPYPVVSQAFCSALPVSYTGVAAGHWESFATLVLEGAYEATLWSAVLNARRHGCDVVFLTQLGGGAFGNRKAWIHQAMRRSLERFANVALDVRIVSYRTVDLGLELLAQELG